MSFHGGFIGVVIAVITFAYINKISLWSLADLVAVASPPGIMLGRLANFINAELWGKPTDLPWGVIFPGEAAQSCNKVIGECARHPSQLYEAFLEGLLLFVLMIFLTRFGVFKLKGFLTGLFLIGYGASRFLVEFFRVPDPQFFSDHNLMGYAYSFGSYGVTMGQALSIPLVLVGAIVLYLSVYFYKRNL